MQRQEGENHGREVLLPYLLPDGYAILTQIDPFFLCPSAPHQVPSHVFSLWLSGFLHSLRFSLPSTFCVVCVQVPVCIGGNVNTWRSEDNCGCRSSGDRVSQQAWNSLNKIVAGQQALGISCPCCSSTGVISTCFHARLYCILFLKCGL